MKDRTCRHGAKQSAGRRTSVAFAATLFPTCVACALTNGAFAPLVSGKALTVPRSPQPPRSVHNAILMIVGPSAIVSGEKLDVHITVVNHGRHFILISGLVPSDYLFPSTWCWGPGPAYTRTTLFRNAPINFAMPQAGSVKRSGAMPGQRHRLRIPINFSHIFDLTMPGRYEAQLAGLGMVSNVIKFRVLPPNLKPRGAALLPRAGAAPQFVTAWGKPRRGVQMGAYWKFNTNGSRVVRVRMLFRVVGHAPRSVRLCGNPEVDFVKFRLTGPMFKSVHALASPLARIANRPPPPSAYGHWLSAHGGAMKASVRWKRYHLTPGKIYQYWRPVVLNRRYDLSVPGPYRFSARLSGSHLTTGTVTVYSYVQPRSFNRPLYERYIDAWKKQHGISQ